MNHVRPKTCQGEPSRTVKGTVRERARDSRLPIPADWKPPPESLADAEERGFTRQDLENEAHQFCNHHRAHGSIREPTGTPPGKNGSSTRANSNAAAAWLAARRPAEVDAALVSRASQLGVELPVRFEIGAGRAERSNATRYLSVDKVGGTPETRDAALVELRRFFLTPPPQREMEAWLAELSVITAKRADDEFTEQLRLKAFSGGWQTIRPTWSARFCSSERGGSGRPGPDSKRSARPSCGNRRAIFLRNRNRDRARGGAGTGGGPHRGPRGHRHRGPRGAKREAERSQAGSRVGRVSERRRLRGLHRPEKMCARQRRPAGRAARRGVDPRSRTSCAESSAEELLDLPALGVARGDVERVRHRLDGARGQEPPVHRRPEPGPAWPDGVSSQRST